MKHRIKRVFEWDLDATLDTLDREGHELIRILDIPKGVVLASECTRCAPDGALCQSHAAERARNLTLRPQAVELKREELVVAVPRYAVVYCEYEPKTPAKAPKKAVPAPKKRKA